MNRILVFGESVDFGKTVERMLGRGHSVAVAQSAEDALRAARRELPDVVICELGLRNRNGLEVCQRFRHSEEFPDIGIVLISTDAIGESNALAAEAGADCLISSPFSLAELEEAVHAALSAHLVTSPLLPPDREPASTSHREVGFALVPPLATEIRPALSPDTVLRDALEELARKPGILWVEWIDATGARHRAPRGTTAFGDSPGDALAAQRESLLATLQSVSGTAEMTLDATPGGLILSKQIDYLMAVRFSSLLLLGKARMLVRRAIRELDRRLQDSASRQRDAI